MNHFVCVGLWTTLCSVHFIIYSPWKLKISDNVILIFFVLAQDMLRVYKETRNGMLGPDYSTKFSPWLASGSLSPRYIYEEVQSPSI